MCVTKPKPQVPQSLSRLFISIFFFSTTPTQVPASDNLCLSWVHLIKLPWLALTAPMVNSPSFVHRMIWGIPCLPTHSLLINLVRHMNLVIPCLPTSSLINLLHHMNSGIPCVRMRDQPAP
ncbi:unnamed protein product, partial [Vitis vinifera]